MQNNKTQLNLTCHPEFVSRSHSAPYGLDLVSRKVPKLRFKEFTDEWQAKKLHCFLEESGKRNYDSNFTKNEVLSVSGEFGIVNQIEFQGRSFAGSLVNNYHVVEKGDIVYTKSPLKANPYGIIKHNSGKPGIVSTLYAVYKCRSCAEPRFLDYHFQLHDNTNKYLRPLVHKGAKNDMKISNSHVLDGQIFSPLREEQAKIADFLTAMDEKLKILDKKKMAFEKYKKGVMQAIFSQKTRFKKLDGSYYPNWEVKKLGEIGVTYNGLTNKSAEDFGTGSLFITYMQVYGNSSIDVSKFAKVEVRTNENQNKAIKGDVFFTTSSETPDEVGFSSVLLENIDDVYLNSFCFGYRLNDLSETMPEYLRFLFRSEIFRIKVVRLAQGSTRFNLSKTALMKIVIEMPNIQEQEKIASFLTSLNHRIDLINKELEQAKLFKKSLLQQMFV